MGIGLTALIGFAGLAVDVARWELTKGAMQGAADRAVLAAGTAAGGDRTVEAMAIAASHGFVHGRDNVQVNIGIPQSGSYAGNSGALEVTISQPARLTFTSLFLKTAPTVVGRAVAVSNAAPTCVVVLGTSGTTTALSGSSRIELPTCDLYNNSSSDPGTAMSGSARIEAKNVYLVSDYSASGSARITVSDTLKTDASPAADPYADRTPPAYSGCDRQNFSLSGSNSASFSAGSTPFVFCGGASASGSTKLTFGPGVYVFTGAFNLSGSSTVTGTGGVTFIFPSGGSMNASGSSSIDLTAPGTGATAGLAIWSTTGGISISGSGSWKVTGGLYAPNGDVTLSGSANSKCTQVIARSLIYSGSSGLLLKHECDGVGVRDVGGSFKLVE